MKERRKSTKGQSENEKREKAIRCKIYDVRERIGDCRVNRDERMRRE